jgi:hypothetical protein
MYFINPPSCYRGQYWADEASCYQYIPPELKEPE